MSRTTVRVVRFLPPTNEKQMREDEIPEEVKSVLVQGANTICFPYISPESFSAMEHPPSLAATTHEGIHIVNSFRFPVPQPKYEIAAEVKVVFHDFDSKCADFCVLRERYKGVAYNLADAHSLTVKYMRPYVAFWQAWSVPVYDDLRRVVYGFLHN